MSVCKTWISYFLRADTWSSKEASATMKYGVKRWSHPKKTGTTLCLVVFLLSAMVIPPFEARLMIATFMENDIDIFTFPMFRGNSLENSQKEYLS